MQDWTPFNPLSSPCLLLSSANPFPRHTRSRSSRSEDTGRGFALGSKNARSLLAPAIPSPIALALRALAFLPGGRVRVGGGNVFVCAQLHHTNLHYWVLPSLCPRPADIRQQGIKILGKKSRHYRMLWRCGWRQAVSAQRRRICVALARRPQAVVLHKRLGTWEIPQFDRMSMTGIEEEQKKKQPRNPEDTIPCKPSL